jgi:hypothetical protein
MGALRDSFQRLLRAEGQSRSAKTVEVFGWLILVEGGLILLAPHIVEWVLDLPALGEQGEHYFRLLGLLVGGVGMLYVVSGRMNAEGFVFASLLDRPLVPFAMALLWHLGIVPGTLALAFAIQDFGSFLWTLTTWLSEHRPSAAAVLERANTFSDDLDSPSIRALQAIYSAAMFEEIKMFQVVDKLVALFRSGTLPLGRGEAADRLRQYAVTAPRRLPESERRAVYQRSLGIGSENGVDSNREFSNLWLRFLSAVKSTAGQDPGTSQDPLRKAAQDLAANLSLHGYGMAYVAATELQSHMRDMLDILSDREIQSAEGARDVWQVIDLVAARDLGGAANTARLRALQSSGATILRWLAARAGGLARASTAPVLNPRERHPTRSSGVSPPPSDYDLVKAVERWFAASA